MSNNNPTITKVIQGENLEFHHDGSLWWEARSTLFLADLHLGKANHFRREGIPIPLAVQEENFDMLTEVMRRYSPKDVFFLGDLFHSKINVTWRKFVEWMQAYPEVQFHLVEGNHDILGEEDYEKAGMIVHPEGLYLEPFTLRHHPDGIEGDYTLCGHLHPGVVLKGKGRQRLRLSCFWIGHDHLVLPAFGAFKGRHIIQPREGDEVLACGREGIYSFS